FIASVAVGFALVFVCYCECVANTRILARVDEWIPVCTGMTAGGAINSLTSSSSRTRGSIRQHSPSLTLITTIPATYVHFPQKQKKPTLFQVLA
ncbi:hypothetical protein ABMX79_03125, partial [Vibrio vulnificus]